MEKSSLFVEVESLCGATGYPLRTPRLEDTVLDAHTREPITVITERYLGVLRFCRWSQPGHNQKLAHLISEIRVERSHLMFCTNCHKIDVTTGYCSWVEIHPFKKKQYNLVSHLMFCTNCHKIDITTGYCSWVEIHPYKEKLVYMYDHHNWARLPILLAVS